MKSNSISRISVLPQAFAMMAIAAISACGGGGGSSVGPGSEVPMAAGAVWELENPGEIKESPPPTLEEFVRDGDTGIVYVANRLLVFFERNTPMQSVQNIVNESGAKIIGYDKRTLFFELAVSDPETVATQLALNPEVKSVSVDMVLEGLEALEAYIPSYTDTPAFFDKNDNGNTWKSNGVEMPPYYTLWSNARLTDVWDESRPYWKNWGWEQIRMPSAWSYLHEVKERTAVGVVDGGVMIEHEDLAFLGVSDKRTIIEDVYDGLSTYQHGTHISSIIASKANNQKGIVGVFPPAQLSAVMLGRLLTQSRQIRAINDLVITQKAKVVNISLGTSYSLPSWLNWLDHNTNIAFKIISNAEGNARSAINALISLGYEFILVTAAGNDSKNAKWSSGFNAISDGITKDHVIVVGATGRLNTSTHWIDYDDVAQYSDYGDSVDVLAPGTMIFGARICSKSSGRSGMNVAIGGRPQTQITSSTSGSGTATAISTNVSVSSTAGASVTVDTSSLPASDELLTQDAESRSCYGSAYGTSFAAPFVSGVAAFVWGINPDLSAKEVKEIILEAAKEYKSISRTDPDGVARTYFILDAKGAVERAIAQRNATTTEGGFDRIAMTRFTLGNVDRIRPLCAVKDHFYVPFAVLGHPIGGSQNEHQFLRGDELRSVVDTISIENTAVAVVDGDIRPKNVGITSVSARYGALRTSQALGIFPTTWESLTGSTIVKDGCKFMLASPIGLCEYAEGPSRQVLGIRSSDGSIISNSVVIENCEIVQNWSNILVYTP